MVNNMKLKLLLPTGQTTKCKVVIDDDVKFTSSAKCGNGDFEKIVFDISPGNHTLKISFAGEKAFNKTGKLKFDFFTASPKEHLNHIFAFHYNVNCFTQTIDMTIHRDAVLLIGLKKENYYNFLNVHTTFLKPYIKKKSNIKINSENFYIFNSLDRKRSFYIKNFFIFSFLTVCILLALIFLSLANFKDWNNNLGAQGFTGKSVFFIGLFPVILYVAISYLIYSIKLYKHYKYTKNDMGIDCLC